MAARAQPGRSDRRDRLGALAPASAAIAAIASIVRSIGSGWSTPVVVEPFAEPRDLGAVDDRAPLAVRGALADVELDRVRADVDDRVAPRAEAERAP